MCFKDLPGGVKSWNLHSDFSQYRYQVICLDQVDDFLAGGRQVLRRAAGGRVLCASRETGVPICVLT